MGILGPGGVALNSSPLNYGLPGISMSTISGLSQAQPNFSVSQTLSASEVLSWVKGKHNLRFGGDYRRVHRDFLGGSNATGSFTFTGLFTEDAAGDQTSGSPIADFLLGLPQSSSIDSSIAKSYLRDNVFDGYARTTGAPSRASRSTLACAGSSLLLTLRNTTISLSSAPIPIRVSPARLKSPPAARGCRVRLSILTVAPLRRALDLPGACPSSRR